MKIWLDDLRDAPSGWVWIKMTEFFIPFLNEHWERVEELSLDHDLGEMHQTGYDAVKWIEEEVFHGRHAPFSIKVHSDNGPGRKNMVAGIAAIERYNNVLRIRTF